MEQDARLGPTEFVGIGLHRPRLPWRLAAHSHPHHELIVLRAGAQRVTIGGHELAAAEGDLLLYPAGVPHAEWAGRGDGLASFFVSFRWPDRPAQAPVLARDTDGRVRVLAGWLYTERQRLPAPGAELPQALLRAMVAELVRLWRGGADTVEDRLRRYVRSHIAEPIGLADLARDAGLSKYHYVRRYRARTGRTPMQAVRAWRLEHARDLILSSSLPLKEVADRSGLSDVYHMSRLFRRCLGVTPGSLRRRSP